MITVDQADLQSSLQRWNSYVAGKIDFTHLAGQQVVRIEGGRLVQTLIKITPPADPAKTREKVRESVDKTFQVLEDRQTSHRWENYSGTKAGLGDVRWYAFTDRAIYGVQRDQDLMGADRDAMYAAYFANRRRSKQGRVLAGQRGKQKIWIWRKISSSPSKVRQLQTRLVKHVGRLKAGWLPSWVALGRPGGTYSPPNWVMRHEGGARGYALNGLGDPRFPQFTLENHAKGAGTQKMADLVRRALIIRSKAMITRMTYLIKHPEKMSEEGAT